MSHTQYSEEDYYLLPDGRYISYHELANNGKYSNRRLEVWYEVPISYVEQLLNTSNWNHNGIKVTPAYFKLRFGDKGSVAVQDENAKGKYPEHIQYVWTTPDGTVFSKDISNRLEKEYQLKLKGINSKLPAFIEEPTIILDEIVSIAKAPENLEELQEKARLEKLQAALDKEEKEYLEWLNSYKGEFKLNLNLSHVYDGNWANSLAGSIDDKKFLDILHSPEMKKYDYMGLGLLAAPWTILGGAAGLGGLSALAGTTAGNIIGNVAGSLAIGDTLEGVQRRFFGRSLGDNVSGTLLSWGVNPFIADMSRPEYWLNPTGRTVTALWNGGKKLITNFADRFTEKGFRLGSNYISVGVPKNTIYSGVPLLEVKVNPIHTKGADLDQLLKIEQAGYNAATITPTEAFNKLSRQELIEAMLRQFSRLDPSVQVTFDGFNNQIIKDFARESKLFMPSKYNEIGDRFVVPYITPDGRQILIAHIHDGVLENIDNLHDATRNVARMAKNRTFGDGELYNINSYRFKVDNPVQQQRIGIDNDVPYVLLQRGARSKPDRIVVDMNSDFTDEMIAGLDVDANGNVLVKTAYPTATNIYGNSTGLIIDKSTDYFMPKLFMLNEPAGQVYLFKNVRDRINYLFLKMVSKGEANIDNVPWETNDIEEHIAREFIRRAARKRNIQTLDYKGQKSLKNEINISLGPEDYPNVFKSWDPKMYYDMIQYLKDAGYTIYPKGYIPPLNINGYRIGGRIKRRFK